MAGKLCVQMKGAEFGFFGIQIGNMNLRQNRPKVKGFIGATENDCSAPDLLQTNYYMGG